MAGGRAVEASLLLSTKKGKKPENKNTHSMYGSECNAATAKAAAVTRIQSPSQEVGSGDKGLGVFMF